MDQLSTPPRRRLSRETRLLIVTITVSAIVLLLLAQLRFPDAAPAPAPVAASPLERLAARASYDDLAAVIGRFEATTAPSLVVLRLAPREDATPRQVTDLLAPPDRTSTTVQYVPALRISATTALAAIGGSVRIAGIVGPTEPSATAGIISTDVIRQVSLVRVPEGPASTVPVLALADLRTPVYVVAVEGTRAGMTLRPIFVGRGDRFDDPRWGRPLLALSAVAATTPGSLVFTLDGQFLGLVVADGAGVAIAGGRDVIDTVGSLAAGQTTPGDAGIAVQPLTPALATATRTPAGVVVSDVRVGGPADGVLEPGDVITAVGGDRVESPEALLLRIARAVPGSRLTLTVARDGQLHQLPLTVAAAPMPTAASRDASSAVDLELVRGRGTTIRAIGADAPAAAAGLAAGDLVVRAGEVSAPTPAQLQAALRATPAGEYLLVTVQRDERQHVLALPGQMETDGGGAAR